MLFTISEQKMFIYNFYRFVSFFVLIICLKISVCVQTQNLETSDFSFDDDSVEHDSITSNFLNQSRKCCAPEDYVEMNSNGSIYCASHEVRNPVLQRGRQFDETENARFGFPNCAHITVANDKYRWFRYGSAIEVGILYIQFPVWLKVSGDYCVDNYHREVGSFKETFVEDEENNFSEFTSSGVNNITRDKSKELLLFCSLENFSGYHFMTGLTLFIMLTSVGFNIATLSTFIITRKTHSSREWMQFSVFIAECLGSLSFAVGTIAITYYYIWKDAIPVFLYVACYYMYTTKFALVIATSVDLLLCIWRPFSALDEASRSKRNRSAIAFCFILPGLIMGMTTLCQYFIRQNGTDDAILDSNIRHTNQLPPFYATTSKLIFVLQMVINMVLAIIATVLIKRQQKKQIKTMDENKAKKNIQKSFVMYIRLIFATELPFTLNFVLLISLSTYSPLNVWLNLCRVTYLLSAVYTFVHFGLNKIRKHQSKKLRNTSTTQTTN